MIVPRQRTPVPLDGLADLLQAAHLDVRGFPLDPDAVALAVAQLKLEHGTDPAGLRGVFGYNFGNIDCGAAERNDPDVCTFQTVPEQEYDAHGRGYLQVHTRRAYPDEQAGLAGYWTRLLDGFPLAYDALASADLDGFAAALKLERYYTADPAVYARDLRARLPA